VPPIPEECKLLRIHVSGDFDTVAYIHEWARRLIERPDVTAWAYTRSWRVPELLLALEILRTLPNVQLFASMDPSCADLPPQGWRRAWIWRDVPKTFALTTPGRVGYWPTEARLMNWRVFNGRKMLVTARANTSNQLVFDGTPSFVCPEETGGKPDCLSCGYCFEGRKHDVTFLEH